MKLNIQHTGIMLSKTLLFLQATGIVPRVSRIVVHFRNRRQRIKPIRNDPEELPKYVDKRFSIASAAPARASDAGIPKRGRMSIAMMNQTIKKAVDQTLTKLEAAYAFDRNDYAYTCYKSTFSAAIVVFFVKATQDGFFHDDATYWKTAAFLALQLITEFSFMLVETLLGEGLIPNMH
ncbi:hypothetical protein HDU97_010416 [Phlyctochytrium planicorne]|nr:hypothetical protein HDU97_010416 [Phlyctochytrium planicorne]